LPVTALVTTGLMFLSPVFYAADAVPERLRFWMQLNPLTFVIEQARGSMIWAQPLNVLGLLIYTLSACLVAWLGFFWFQKTRKGFADVL
jgi:lipopolysaccharide transport system permease protein